MSSRPDSLHNRFRLAIILETAAFLAPELPGLELHGANVATGALLRRFIADPAVETVEFFVPAAQMLDEVMLAGIAASTIPAEKRGRHALSFYPLHAFPEVLSDALPRIIYCMDPEWMARDRYLRDRFALGPTPVVCDMHALGHHRLWNKLRPFATASHVPYDSIVAISAAARETLRLALSGFLNPARHTPPCRLDLIPRGVDTEYFKPVGAEARVKARTAIGVPSTGVGVLFLGRLTPYSKADLVPLIRAFSRAEPEGDAWLLIAGKENTPGYADSLTRVAQACGLGDRVIVQRTVEPDRRHLFYGAADIFVFPGDTIQETFGNTAAEAMACGLPAIVSDWDGLRDIVMDSETGYTIPTRIMPRSERLEALSPVNPFLTEYLFHAQSVWVDVAALERALATLLASEPLRASMGASARVRAQSHFSWSFIMPRWTALWNELMQAAKEEPADEAKARRAGAAKLGTPTRYSELFAHYSTATFNPQVDRVRLTETGARAARHDAPIEIYDEMAPILHHSVLEGLCEAMDQVEYRTIESVCTTVALSTGVDADDIRYHLAVLLKQELVEVEFVDPS